MAMRKKSAGTRTSKRKTRKTSPPPPSPPKTCPTTAPTRTISDLPNELLLKIFEFSIEQDPNNPHKPSRTARHTSQVCHRWRNVSLNWPELWAASVDFGDPVLWIDEVIKRAVPSKITMVIPSVTESMMKNTVPEDAHHRPQVRLGDLLMRWDCTVQLETLLFQCIHHLSRCREVALKVPGQAWSRLNSFMQDLSNVESLTLVRIGSEFPRSPEELLFHAPIVVSDDPPPWKLRALDLRWCGTRFRSPAFYQLEELTVSDVPTDVAIGPDVWIDVLDRMRSLRRLELANATLTRAYYVESENEGLKHRLGPPINLPHLEWLKLEAPLHHINHLLSSIVVPAECELNLAGCGFSSLNPAFHSLLALVDSRKIGNKLQVALTADSFIIRSSGSGALPLELSLRWNEPPMLAVHDRPIDPQDLFSAATAALAKSCGSVTDLDLTFGVPIDGAKHGAILNKFLRPFTALQRLGGVSSSTFVFLLPFFQPSLQPEKPKDDGTYMSDLLPALESIRFVGIDFREPAGQGRSKYWALLSFIHYRSRKPVASSDNVEEGSPRPSPIFDVRLRSCFGMGEKQMESLESLGAQVLPRRFGRD
ncbi:hypothetical protein NLJ89_g9262 [Agrocybe chaxingu]|uniref:F-box domain-containing protein n=1 Tax=Agrocybe chaxingu TaxID=84603 RepID=A0A9W8MTQ2_9AGAR|nr:hypothetical protein NLJ89_g9262 [Agrocybe chaxingu]